MLKRFLLALTFLSLLASLEPAPAQQTPPAPPPAGRPKKEREEERDEEPQRNPHHSLANIRKLLDVDVPQIDRFRSQYDRLYKQNLGLQRPIGELLADPEGFQKAARAAADIYQAGGFEAVQEAFKRGWITAAESERIAAIRNEMLARACDEIAKKYGSIGTNNFSIARSVKSDIDFTLFARWHAGSGPSPAGPAPGGAEIKEEFYRAYRRLWGIDAGKMEIAAHIAEASIPDWRQYRDTSKFAVAYKKGSALLAANPEAYFLEGAYRMQIDRRSFGGKERLFTIHNGNPVEDTADRREYHTARDAVYRRVPPELRSGYAFGAAAGNFHFFRHHAGDPLHYTKYVLRSVDDGMRLLHLKEGESLVEWKDWMDLDDEARDRALYEAYPPGSRIPRGEVRSILERAARIRAASGNYGDPAAQWEIWKDQAAQIYSEKLGGKGEPPSEMRADLIKESESNYRKRCTDLMIENCIQASRSRAKDWTDAEALVRNLDKTRLPDGGIDEKTLANNLRLAAYHEFYAAFQDLDPAVRRRVIDHAQGEARGLLEKIDRLVELKQRLFRAPAAEKRGDLEFFKKLAASWDEEVGKLELAFYEIKTEAEYRGARKMAMERLRAWTLDSLGLSLDKPLRKLEGAGERARLQFDSAKLVGNIVNLGNADSLLEVIRAGQQSEWDPEVVGEAIFFQALSNLPYVGPLMAVHGALFEGEVVGLGVLAVAYLWPVAGQVYLVYSVGKNAFDIIYHEVGEGIVDNLIDGTAPGETAGARRIILTSWSEWDLPQLDDRAEEQRTKFLSVLRLAPGDTPAERRKSFFPAIDAILDGKLRAKGFDPLEWDGRKKAVIEAYFGTYLKGFLEASGPFAGDFELEKFWKSESSRAQRDWLADADIRRRLIDRLSKMYVQGLDRRAAEEGHKAQEAMQEDAAAFASRVQQLEDHFRKAAGYSRHLGALTGQADYPDPVTVDDPGPEPRGRVAIKVPPGARVELDRPIALEGVAEELSGQFTKPFRWKWSFVNLPRGAAPAAGAAGEDLGFASVPLGKQAKLPETVRVRAEVRDSSREAFEESLLVGRAEADLPAARAAEPEDVKVAFAGSRKPFGKDRFPVGEVVPECLYVTPVIAYRLTEACDPKSLRLTVEIYHGAEMASKEDLLTGDWIHTRKPGPEPKPGQTDRAYGTAGAHELQLLNAEETSWDYDLRFKVQFERLRGGEWTTLAKRDFKIRQISRTWRLTEVVLEGPTARGNPPELEVMLRNPPNGFKVRRTFYTGGVKSYQAWISASMFPEFTFDGGAWVGELNGKRESLRGRDNAAPGGEHLRLDIAMVLEGGKTFLNNTGAIIDARGQRVVRTPETNEGRIDAYGIGHKLLADIEALPGETCSEKLRFRFDVKAGGERARFTATYVHENALPKNWNGTPRVTRSETVRPLAAAERPAAGGKSGASGAGGESRRMPEAARPPASPPPPAAVSGEVLVNRKGAKGPAPLRPGEAVAAGDELRTGKDGRALLKLPSSSTVSVGKSSTVGIEEWTSTGKAEKVSLSLRSGEVEFDVKRPAGWTSSVEVKTPAGKISTRGTRFLVKSSPAFTEVSVSAGAVLVEGRRIVKLESGGRWAAIAGSSLEAAAGVTARLLVEEKALLGRGSASGEKVAGGKSGAGKTAASENRNPQAGASPSAVEILSSTAPWCFPEFQALIDEWLSVAEPAIDAGRGSGFRYEEWGRVIASGAKAAGPVEVPPGVTRHQFLWQEAHGLDSLNHCTLKEWVTRKLEGKSTEDCRGRQLRTPAAGWGAAAARARQGLEAGAETGAGAGKGAGAGASGDSGKQ